MSSQVDPAWADRILRHLGEIVAGRCTITDRAIADEPSEEMRQILVALLLMHEDLVYSREQREQAEHARRQVSEESEKLLSELRVAVRARDEFLAIASHELRTPVTTFALELEALSSLLQRPSGVEAIRERSMPRMRRQLDRLKTLLEEMLDVSRIAVGRLELLPREMDLAALVDDVVERFRPAAEDRGVALELTLARPVLGCWDGARIDQVITNLLSNALKYGDGKAVSVVLRAEPARAVLTVRDRGIGISEVDRERIFAAYARSEASRNHAGLGLGLWISQRIVDASGGGIRVEDADGPGVQFVVELPR